MRQPVSMTSIRNSIISNRGKEVVIKTNKGRNRFDIARGVIAQVYPCVFMVKVGDGASAEASRMVSFSYTDILTKEVEIDYCLAKA